MNKIITDLPDSDYRKAEGLSNSMLKHFMQSPAHYQSALSEPKETTKAMNFGTALHQKVLTPELDAVVVLPEFDARTKEGKAIREKFEQESVGKTVLTAKEADVLFRMADSILSHPTASDLIKRLKNKETSVFSSMFGVPTKSRLDMVDLDSLVIGDLKSCEDASCEGIRKAIRSYRYDIQEVFYRTNLSNATGKNCEEFFFIFVEKTPPFPVNVIQIGMRSREFASREWFNAMQDFKKCSESNIWPSYGDDIKVIEI